MSLVGSTSNIFHTKATVCINLLAPYYYRDGCPKGEMYIMDLQGFEAVKDIGYLIAERISYDNLSSRFVLVYFEDGL
ncbi:MAG: hypothetical protein CME61_00725 [Halobacteriovoraceae bacterium]|nr:hypothetical protein [Halobacteriovoraceae bacterium]